jgi:hypothetical protein
MTVLNIAGVTLEENVGCLKIVLPVQRQWVYLGIYSLLLVVWLGMAVFGLIFTGRMAFSGERFAFVFTLLLLVFLFVLYRLGQTIWRQWQFYVANREILFLFDDHLVIRRPVSLLGITTAYDRQYVRPFHYDEAQHSPSFEYGNRYVPFGLGLSRPDAGELVQFLNGRYFPNYHDED